MKHTALPMHLLQQKILELSKKVNLGSLSLREIGEKIDEPHPQKVKHHLDQLLKKGFLKEDKEKGLIRRVDQGNGNEPFYNLPILGSANCGQALTFAEEGYEGFLQVSQSVLPRYDKDKFFVVKAVGNSMNRADINGKHLEEGDYAIVDTTSHNSNFYNGKYVLSVINGMANIKKLKRDSQNERLILLSESSQDYPPIVIHEDDFQGYLVNGHVVEVVKKP